MLLLQIFMHFMHHVGNEATMPLKSEWHAWVAVGVSGNEAGTPACPTHGPRVRVIPGHLCFPNPPKLRVSRQPPPHLTQLSAHRKEVDVTPGDFN